MFKKLFLSSFLCVATAYSLPQGADVKNGSVDIQMPSESSLKVTSSDKAVISWDSFSIEALESVKFVQPSSKSAVLNTVSTNSPSEIYGSLTANGKLYLINESGILVGPDAVVNTAEFVASTLPASEAEFIEGMDLLFQGDSDAQIVNLGKINAKNNIYIFAERIENEGEMRVSKGEVSLLSGHEIFLQDGKNPLLRITPDFESGSVETSGVIEALEVQIESNGVHGLGIRQSPKGKISILKEGGKVLLKTRGSMINNEGQISAISGDVTIVADSTKNKAGAVCQIGTIDVSGPSGGRIEINAAKCQQSGSLLADGTDLSGGEIIVNIPGSFLETGAAILSATGKDKGGAISVCSDGSGNYHSSGSYDVSGNVGGNIKVTAGNVKLIGADLKANGATQAGEINIGGGYRGRDRTLPNANSTFLSCFTKIEANSDPIKGRGGKVIIRANDKLEQFGTIEALGHHGFINLYGKDLFSGGSTTASQVLQQR